MGPRTAPPSCAGPLRCGGRRRRRSVRLSGAAASGEAPGVGGGGQRLSPPRRGAGPSGAERSLPRQGWGSPQRGEAGAAPGSAAAAGGAQRRPPLGGLGPGLPGGRHSGPASPRREGSPGGCGGPSAFTARHGADVRLSQPRGLPKCQGTGEGGSELSERGLNRICQQQKVPTSRLLFPQRSQISVRILHKTREGLTLTERRRLWPWGTAPVKDARGSFPLHEGVDVQIAYMK